jgi:hypothetical protein
MRLKTASSLMLAGMAMLATVAQARPELVISNDQRALIYIGSFGFLPGGTLDMNLQNLKVRERMFLFRVDTAA